jgi:hypothetical protein
MAKKSEARRRRDAVIEEVLRRLELMTDRAIEYEFATIENDKQVPVVTAWSGQAQTLEGGIDQIDSMWILTESTAVKEDWQSQMIGKDVFNRVVASAADVRRAMASKGIKKLNVEPGTPPPQP